MKKVYPVYLESSRGGSYRRGFAPILILIVVALIAVGSASYVLYFKKTNPSNTSISQSRNLSLPEKENQDIQKSGILQQLLDKMKTYNNYQLDLHITPSSGKVRDLKIVRLQQKQLQPDQIVDLYIDESIGKNYSFYREKNVYGEWQSEDSGRLGKPEYYFRIWTGDTKAKNEETIDQEKVQVYENFSDGNTNTAYISAKTGLPVKMVQKNSKGETIITFNFSRINEVQESEVTLPLSAKKIANLQ